MDSPLLETESPDIEAVVEFLKPRRRISGRRVLRGRSGAPVPSFTKEESLLMQGLFSASIPTRRWRTLVERAGSARHGLLLNVVRKLLTAQWIEVAEQRDRRGWNPVELRVLDPHRLRDAAGLEDLVAREAQLRQVRAYVPRSPIVARLRTVLDRATARMQLRRAIWLPAIDAWLSAGRTGTLRDFAYALTGRTKGLTPGDIAWLRAHEVVEACSLVPHAFQLLVAGHFALGGPWHAGVEWRIGPFPGPTGLGEDALTGEVRMTPRAWVVIENRTVFDRAARIPSRCGMIWVPGYAPGAWLALMGRLLDRMPANAVVLCDPDPAGVELALRALRPWRERGLAWQVEGMSSEDTKNLPSDQPLNEWDVQALERVTPEVAGTPLETTVRWLATQRRKAEQEPVWSEEKLSAMLRSMEDPGCRDESRR